MLADQVAYTVKAHNGRSTGRSTPPVVACNVIKNGDMRFTPLELILADHLAHLPLPW